MTKICWRWKSHLELKSFVRLNFFVGWQNNLFHYLASGEIKACGQSCCRMSFDLNSSVSFDLKQIATTLAAGFSFALIPKPGGGKLPASRLADGFPALP